ncbi:hypothetical protein H261_05669 [Paramagnetospirillum caucaseum]|uniref:Uncharacterized protein n=1 Tax=Paramagnetospirillum caucaseum TaxID=1244869 RepID=M2ZU20_9PROT|nr:tetratricopeptide repeat protein [Paramagnetospirillum caucaseum]EME70872.1 hypothetical protein H261_05669 [Paramagnetospirillum caucaseum]
MTAVALLLAACTSPVYVDRSQEEEAPPLALNAVSFRVHQSLAARPPSCVAVLPLSGPDGDAALEPARIEAVRRAVYAHLAPHGRRDVKPARVDFVLERLDPARRGDAAEIGRALDCEALIGGKVTESGRQFLGVYSRVAVGAELRMVRAAGGEVLWEGTHVASLHAGGLPISPIGIAMGIFEAARNMDDEQILRATDDLARRLASTIPDPGIVALDDPTEPPAPVRALPLSPEPPRKAGLDAFLEELAPLAADERRARLIQALEQRRFGDMARAPLLDALVAVPDARPEDFLRHAEYLAEAGDYASALARAEQAAARDASFAPAHFAMGRMRIKQNDPSRAEADIIRAVALDGDNATYLNGLAYVNSLRGRADRALAAYAMAIRADAANGFAYYNSGVILLDQGDRVAAADAFYGAGLAYLKTGHYGQAGKALADLKELSGPGLDLSREIDTIQGALAALEQKAKAP